MRLSRRYLEGLATETAFREETLEKVLRLGEVSADISRHPLLSLVLALKGGTALNLCFSTPRRLSIDLDFNYVGAEERSKMLEDRPGIEAPCARSPTEGAIRFRYLGTSMRVASSF